MVRRFSAVRVRRSKSLRAVALGLTVVLLSSIGADARLGGGGNGHQPVAAPQQRWGTAAGLPHLAGGSPNKSLPTTERGRHPRLAGVAEPANIASVEAGPSQARTGFDRAGSKEILGARDAFEKVYSNADGTETTELSATPVHYRGADGAWKPINTTVVPGVNGDWRNITNTVALQFAARADSPELVRVGVEGDHSIAYGLAGATSVRAKVQGSTVTYGGVRPGVDMRLDVQPGGVKETLVLQGKPADNTFTFPLRLSGLRAAVVNGEVVFADAAGTTRAVIPRGDLTDAAGVRSTAVGYELVDGALRVTADRDWLADPARKYPVELDPTVGPPLNSGAADGAMYVRGAESVPGTAQLQVGKVDGVSTASYVAFGSLVNSLKFETIYGAQLLVGSYFANSCRARAVTVHPVTQAWTPSGSYSFPGPGVGAALGSKSFAHGFVAEGQSTSACPPAAELIDLGSGGVDLVQGWVNGTTPNNGLSLRADVSDPLSGKRLTGTATDNPPRLYVTHSPYNATYALPKPVPDPPVLQNQDGKVKFTVTNRGAKEWTAGQYYLAYRVYNAKTGAAIGQQRSASLPGTIARGASVTVDATIKALPPGSYFVDFSMVGPGGVFFTDHLVTPLRLSLRVVDIPPVVQELYPPNGYRAPTLTPTLWGRALDIDAPPGSSLSFKFEVCEANSAGNPVNCFDSGYQSAQAWAPPAAKLAWAKSYLWRVFVKDAANEVTSSRSTVLTEVPQPEITSHLAGASKGADDQDFDGQSGNVTTAAVDASAATVGPDLSVARTYNSTDPRRDGLFGAGWTSRFDMRLVPDDDGSGNVVVTYADGQTVRYGRNPDGTYAPGRGRTAVLTAAAGAWTLDDRSGTLYSFSSSGRLTRITDNAGRALVLTYSNTDGKLAKAQVSTSQTNTAGRALRFTWTGAHVTAVTTDLNTVWKYTYTGDTLTSVCAPDNSCTRYTYGQGSHYRTAVLDDRPDSYWRLGEAQGTAAGSEMAVNLGKDAGTHVGVMLGSPGAVAGSAGTAAAFNGTSSRIDLPKGALKKSRDSAVELWFKASPTGTGGPLLGYQDKAFDSPPGRGVPILYVGTDGKLRGQFGATAIAPLASSGTVNDGRWHHAVLSQMGTTQTLYLDGVQAAQATGVTIDHSLLTFNQVGAATATGTWPEWGSAGKRFFTGTIDEVAVYAHPLGAAAVAAHHRYGSGSADQLTKITMPSGAQAAAATYDTVLDRVATYTDRDGGTWKIGAPLVFGDDTDLRRTVQVRDPANRPRLYEYDALSGLLLRAGLPLGLELRDEDRPGSAPPEPTPVEKCEKPDPADPSFCTVIPGDAGGPVFETQPTGGLAIRTYQYDQAGNLSVATNENGDSVALTYDGQGHAVSTRTCQSAGVCHTSYTTYPAAAPDPSDPRNDLPLETRDGRSASATDTTFRTSYTYSPNGNLTSKTTPDGNVVRSTYTVGAESAVGGGVVPAGLPLTSTDARGKVTRFSYYANGDLAKLTEPSGLVTSYTYDVLGRQVSETEVSDAFPAGLTTTLAYDAMSRLTNVTGSVTTNAVDGTRHQRRTVTTYDTDGNVTQVDDSDVLGGDGTRTVKTEYDESGRPTKVVDPEGNETTTGYDRHGNRTSTVDANGNRYDFAYTARNMIAEIRLRAYTGDTSGGLTDGYLVLHSYSYDFAGRQVSDTDAMGRRTEFQYTGNDLLRKAVLKNLHNPDGATRDYVLSDITYDGAGNPIKQISHNGATTVTSTYDRLGNLLTSTEDPDGLARSTTHTYDATGNVTRTSRNGRASNVPWAISPDPEVVDLAYDDSGNVIRQTTSTGDTTLVTTSAYDQRGNLVADTDPRGNATGADPAAYTTNYTYDEFGRQTVVTGAPVKAENGGAAQTVRPVVTTGYNTFGEPVAVKDETGSIVRTAYDRLGRAVSQTKPAYTPPGASTPITPVTRTKYDGLGNVLEITDPLGNAQRFGYDQLNRQVTLDKPLANNGERAIWRSTYTRTGQRLATTDPLGGRSEATYDDLDRAVTHTKVERFPRLDNLITRLTYDDRGAVTATTEPSGAVSRNAFDTLGQLIRETDASGVVTQYGYDKSGRPVRESDAAGRTSQTSYDRIGRVAATSDLRPDGTTARMERLSYDLAGNPASTVDAKGVVTTFEFDAANRLVTQTEPVAAGSSITTSFGYDAADRRTRYTDGRGNPTHFTYNVLGLPESVIEPPTPAHSAAADRTWTAVYDAAGAQVRTIIPGGVSTTTVYDAAGRVTQRSGTGAAVPTATQNRTYDAMDRLTSAGGNTFSYNDRGQPLTARGPAGSADFSYDADGNLTSRTDAAGTATFTYSNGRLSTMTDGLTRVTEFLGYDLTGRRANIGYGDGRVRTFTYDDLGRPDTDVLRNSSGQSVAAIDYGYDDNDNLTSKTTSGFAGSGSNTYGYDLAGRLTSWTAAGGTVSYGWDASGNRVSAGTTTSVYDARNRLVSSGGVDYAYSARGTLNSAGTRTYGFDAFDHKLADGSLTYTYDDLDRLVSRGSTKFSYAGLAANPVAAGAEKFARDPDGDPLAVGDSLVVADEHGDVVGGFGAADALAALPDSTTYDPFGRTTASQGDDGSLGYQGDWTDPDSGAVSMGARWYDPSTGAFQSRDQVTYAGGDSALANRYAYGAANPLKHVDPDGNWPCVSWKCLKNKANEVVNDVKQGVSNVFNTGKKIVRKVVNAGRKIVGKVVNGIKSVVKKVGNAIKKGINEFRQFARDPGGYVKQKAKQFWGYAKKKTKQMSEALRKAKAAAEQKARAIAKKIADRKITKTALAAIEKTVKSVVLKTNTPVNAITWLGGQLVRGTASVLKMPNVPAMNLVNDKASDDYGKSFLERLLDRMGEDFPEAVKGSADALEWVAEQLADPFVDRGMCENWFHCGWEGGWQIGTRLTGTSGISSLIGAKKGGSGAPDYVTVDIGEILPFPAGGRNKGSGLSGSLTLTRNGQLSVGGSQTVGTPGAGVGASYGWFLKENMTGADVDKAATGWDADLSVGFAGRRGRGPTIGLTRSLDPSGSGEKPIRAIEVGVSAELRLPKEPAEPGFSYEAGYGYSHEIWHCCK
ncbi:RHS repeat-associated core domain-containing protein [Lentzea aerocolonigenes]|uniref:RHS repeat-associated core domain-containing protein n=1 Tax=Lentzea aerocolonigenes TaxID=68170 RepID=UPI0012E1D91E|nr:RHS repeat-associated core domain-containing protein [Lentzea aerocolonigenes]